MDNSSTSISLFAPYFKIDDTPFYMKIGGTTYEITTRFSAKGKESVLQQFQDLLTEMNLV